MKHFVRLCLLAVLAVSIFAVSNSTSYAATSNDATLEGFIDWMLERDDLTDEQLTDLENAQSMLDEYVEAGYIDLSDEDDAASLDNLHQAIVVLQTIEDYRNEDEYYNQLYDMTNFYTNFTMMVGSAYTADVSIYKVAHVSNYSAFSYCENLAWGYTNAAKPWYNEVTYVNRAMENLGYSVDTLTLDQWSEVLSLASSYWTIGHYTNLFIGLEAGYDTVAGVGYTTEANLYTTTTSYNASVKPKSSSVYTGYAGYAVYTPDEFEDLLEEYEETLLETATVTLSYDSISYNGAERKPSVTVTTASGKTLTKGTDYTVTYSDNVDAGTATVTVKGKGDYTGTATATFTIKQKLISSDSSAATVTLSTTEYTYNGTARKPTATVKLTLKAGRTTLKKGTDYTVSYKNNKKAGTATVTITGTGNYRGTLTKTFTIKQKLISSESSAAKVTLSTSSYTYNGNAKTPTPTVKITLNGETTTLKKGTDYTVTYSSNKAIGTATVKIKGTGNYRGTLTKTFTIKPKQATISSAKSSTSKKITVTWKKVSGSVTKYQVRYRVKGTSTWTTKTVSSSSLSKTLTGLKSGKKYQIQVRAYKTVSGTKYYGAWSSTKTVTCK